jgi:nucleoside triphosphate pyrophosphatase
MTDKLVLASASPRRSELLGKMGINFQICKSTVDESTIKATSPSAFAVQAAYAKAQEVCERQEPNIWVLAADTVVTLDGTIYGKPTDRDDAFQMLCQLSGKPHEVITGVALCKAGTMQSHLKSVSTTVVFKELEKGQIEGYLDTGEPFDKAGAYGIQGKGGDLVSHIEGDYFNVVGLPCEMLLGILEEVEFGCETKLPVPPERWSR